MISENKTQGRVEWPIHLDRVKARPEGQKGNYVAHFFINGTHSKRALKTRNAEVARKKALAIETQLAAGNLEATPARKKIAEAIKLFIESKRIDNLADETLDRYETELNCFANFMASHGVFYLHQVTETLAESYKPHRRTLRLDFKSAKELHEGTLFISMQAIKSFFRWCCRRGRLLARNPLEWLPDNPPPFQRKYAPTLEVVDKILAAAEMPRLAQYAFLAFTGARSGEMALMKRHHIDLTTGWAQVPTFKRKCTRITGWRKIPLHPRLVSILKAYIEAFPASASAPLFAAAPSTKYPAGDHPICTSKLNDKFKQVAASLGFPVGRAVDGLVIHSLRHFLETFAHNHGVPQRVIDAWLGHGGGKTMGNVYYRLSDADSKKFMDNLPFGSHN